MAERRTQLVAVGIVALLVPLVAALAIRGCRKDEPPPPLETAPAPPPSSSVVLVPPPEDAGADADAGDAAPDASPGKPLDLTGLRACCAALSQNASSMPPPQSLYAANAAGLCTATVASINSPSQKDAMLASIRTALRGSPMPAQCR